MQGGESIYYHFLNKILYFYVKTNSKVLETGTVLSSGSPRWRRYSQCPQRNAYSSSRKDLYIKKYKKMWLLFNHRGTITPILLLWNSLEILSKHRLGNECSSFGWDLFSINAAMDYCTVTLNLNNRGWPECLLCEKTWLGAGTQQASDIQVCPWWAWNLGGETHP